MADALNALNWCFSSALSIINTWTSTPVFNWFFGALMLALVLKIYSTFS